MDIAEPAPLADCSLQVVDEMLIDAIQNDAPVGVFVKEIARRGAVPLAYFLSPEKVMAYRPKVAWGPRPSEACHEDR